jgi:CDP-paratose 2-epimerase
MYGATKLASELLVQEYNDMYGLRGFVDRCGVIAGAWQMGKVEQGVVSLWVAKHLWPGELAYLGFGGAGKQVRDLLSVDDLYRLVALQMKAMDSINGQVFNVGGGANFSVSLLELTELCQQLTGNRVTIGSVEETREGDVPYYVSDCRLLQKYIDWEPSKSPQDIVLDVFHWLVANESSVRPILTAV